MDDFGNRTSPHTDDVAAVLAELAAVYDEAPRLDGGLREKLDALAEDGMVHRLEDASRAGSLARYRNRQSVYQFSELGYRAFTAVEDVLSARIRDANLSRLVFSDILDDLRALAAAARAQDSEQVYRRLSSPEAVSCAITATLTGRGSPSRVRSSAGMGYCRGG